MAVDKGLEEKWRKAFRVIDVDKDGYHTKTDMETIANTMASLTGASEMSAQHAREEVGKWIKLLEPDGSTEKIDEDTYVREIGKMHQDLDKHVQFTESTYRGMFSAIDSNHDGKISLSELEAFYRGFNITDRQFVLTVFQNLDLDGDGSIDRSEFIQAGVNYWTNTDPGQGCAFMYDPPTLLQ